MANKRKAAWGDRVQISYTGRRKDGAVVDASLAGEPLCFQIGTDGVFAGFQRAAEGLCVGEHRTIRLEAVEAYGERDHSLVRRVALSATAPPPQVGQIVEQAGRRALVTAIAGLEMTVDANHPLAGQALTYDIRLVAIDPPV